MHHKNHTEGHKIEVGWRTTNSLKENQDKGGGFNYVGLPKPQQKFIIYAGASNKSIGGIITQDGCVISCFLKKFNEAQVKYPTTEQELLVPGNPQVPPQHHLQWTSS